MPPTLFVITGPSGVGKTTIANELLMRVPWLQKVVTHTTRPAREGEVDGQDYHFETEENFMSMIQRSRFLEYARVYGHLYGTTTKALPKVRDAGKKPLMVLDEQGSWWWQDTYPDSVATILILPPSQEELVCRLQKRGLDSEEVIKERLESETKIKPPVSRCGYVACNRDLNTTVDGIVEFIRSVGLKN